VRREGQVARSLSLPIASGAIAVGLLRLLILPIVLAGALLVPHSPDRSGPFAFVLAGGAIYAAALLAVHVSRLRRGGAARGYRAEPFIDLLLLCALAYTSGGPFSQARLAFFALPLVAAFRLRPQLTAIWSAIAVASYVAVSLSHPAVHAHHAPAQVIVGALYLAWTGTAAVALTALLARLANRITRLADERRSLVRQALEAESRARQKLAGVLHDESVQTLLVAGQELQDARRGDAGALDRAETAVRLSIARLREEITDLHPHVLDHAGLEAALEDLASRWSERAGIPVTTRIDQRATGHHDGLIFSVAEEFLANAARHASARNVELELGVRAEEIELRVSDDGSGIDPALRAEAVAHGHLGLATISERVQATGGRLDVSAAAGRGTTAVATLPAVFTRASREHADHAIG
jgi:two-component system NarL family sensor kinase